MKRMDDELYEILAKELQKAIDEEIIKELSLLDSHTLVILNQEHSYLYLGKAKEWCEITFPNEVEFIDPNKFFFKNPAHATWFKVKWN